MAWLALDGSTVFQDSDGFIWIGTYAGLNRYDGSDFIHLKHIQGDSTSLRDNIVLDILEHEGRLWIATMFGGVHVLNRKSLKVEKVIQIFDPLIADKGIANSLPSIKTTKKTSGWEQNSGDYFYLIVQVIDFTQYYPAIPDTTFHPSRGVQCIYEDESGILWLGTERGLGAFQPTLPKYIVFFIINDSRATLANARENISSAIFEKTNPTYYGLATVRTGLCYLNKDTEQSIQVLDAIPVLQNEVILDITTSKKWHAVVCRYRKSSSPIILHNNSSVGIQLIFCTQIRQV